MILSQLKAHLAASEPSTREFVALMDTTFRFYSETRSIFLEKLPQHLLQSELISLINVELKERLFNEKFCLGIKDALKAIQRAIVRLENLRKAHPHHPDAVNDLTKLIAIAEQVEALYQKHWEYYRYQGRIGEEELVSFLLEIDQVAYHWDIYLSGFSAVSGVMESLQGQPCPPDMTPLRISYQRDGVSHFSVTAMCAVMNFLEVGYRFICAAAEIDVEIHPLSMLQVEVAEPIELVLSVPGLAAPSYRKFLQYLFLKDMLKRDALLKIVFEAVGRELQPAKSLPPALLSRFQKEMTAALKQLPPGGRFTISGRNFPEDAIQVLQEFTETLDGKNIRYDAMLRREPSKIGKSKTAPRLKEGAKTEPAGSRQGAIKEYGNRPEAPGALFQKMDEKDHIAVLTERKS